MLGRLFGRDDGCIEVRDKAGGVHRVPRIVLTLRPGITREQAMAAIAPYDRYRNMNRAFAEDETWPIRISCRAGIVESIIYPGFVGPEAVVDGIFSGMAVDEALRQRPDVAPVPVLYGNTNGYMEYLSRVDAGVADEIGFAVVNGKVTWIALRPAGYAREKAEARRQFEAKEAKIQARRDEARRRRTMTDPTERLLSWAKVAEYWGVEDGRFIWYAERLIAATPDEWYDAASTWNWDYGREPLRWIISQPNCDTATVKRVFEGLACSYGPEDISDRRGSDADNGEDLDLIDAIISRWQSGFWTRRELAYEPEEDPEPRRDKETAIETAFRQLAAPQAGRTVRPGCFLAGTPYVQSFS